MTGSYTLSFWLVLLSNRRLINIRKLNRSRSDILVERCGNVGRVRFLHETGAWPNGKAGFSDNTLDI